MAHIEAKMGRGPDFLNTHPASEKRVEVSSSVTFHLLDVLTHSLCHTIILHALSVCSAYKNSSPKPTKSKPSRPTALG